MVDKQPLPNIIIFVPDEMRGDTVSLGKKNNPYINTPNIDRLANDGVAFTQCFTVNPVCTPSRCCTFTGQYVHSNSHRSLYQLLQPHEENLFKFLKKKGYEVMWIGRNDLFGKKTGKESTSKYISIFSLIGNPKEYLSRMKSNPFPKDHRFRKSFYYGERTQEQANDIDYLIIQSALDYLDSKPKKPFCLYITIGFPHPPYTVEEPYFSMYDRNKIPAPIPPKLDDKPEFMQIIHERYGLYNLNENDFREILGTYYGMVSRVDYQFGQILDKLEEINEYENSAIFFFSDHGDYAGNYGLTEKWPNAFQDSLINIPLVCKIPDISPKKKVWDELVESIDIFPTIMNIANISSPYTHFGINLIPFIEGERVSHRNAVFAEGGYNSREPQCFEMVVKDPNIPQIGIYYDKTNIPKENRSTSTRSAMVRTKEWKLIIRNSAMGELYDLMNDPNEINNLIDIEEYSQIKSNLKDKLLQWYLNTSDNPHYERERSI